MKLYIDKKNIESFVLSAKTSIQEFNLCNNMLKKHFDMHLNVSKEEFFDSPLCMAWSNSLLEGCGEGKRDIIHFDGPNNIFPHRPINPTYFSNGFDMEQHMAVYLLDDKDVSPLREHGNYIVGGVGYETETLHQLIIGDEDQLYTQELPLKKHFSQGNWEGLNESILPCSDIIISDPYILSNKSLYSTNLIPLLQKISQQVVYTSVNIVIFCLSSTTDKKGNVYAPIWSDVRNLIKDKLNQVDIEANVTFVAAATEKDFGEHDRTLCTNYMLYTPGKGFNIYDTQGKLTENGRYFHVHSSAKSEHFSDVLNYIADMQSLIDDIENSRKTGIIEKDSAPKLSNFLHFS